MTSPKATTVGISLRLPTEQVSRLCQAIGRMQVRTGRDITRTEAIGQAVELWIARVERQKTK